MNNQKSITTLTLDAGGTNFVFSAIQDNREVVSPVTLPANADDLEACLQCIIDGFEGVKKQLETAPAAISFAFPGPADYQLGIIGNLPNFKAFNGNVPLGPMLEDHFGIPVFINNDGNLFAYGEARSGALPEINQKLEEHGWQRRFHNLIGITLGTGIGCGIAVNGQLLTGDNSCGGEIHNTLNTRNFRWNAEESVSTRAIRRVYLERSGSVFDPRLMPGEIYRIAKGETEGNRQAAVNAFKEFGSALGDTIANVLTLIDGLVVLGGGLTSGHDLFFPAMFERLRMPYENFKGELSERLSFPIFDLTDPDQLSRFLNPEEMKLAIPRSERTIGYRNEIRGGIVLSKMGASKAIALGAHAFALSKLSES